jgi:hypothetical protein|nr:MAG TPA: terminase small subunit [Caudoviricetes sp.]DAT95915.1 MAG TPA: terminase small subunit [Caudoviricetes sp.]
MAGEYEHIKGKGNRFSSTNQPENRGRKPKLYTIAKKAYNVSREEWNEVKMYLLQCTPQEIDKIIGKEDTPMWVLILARGLKRNAAKGMTDVLDGMEDRLFGRAPVASNEDADIPTDIEHGINIDSWIKDKLK